MSGKPVLLRELARRDAGTALDYYVREAGPKVALRFVDALETTYRTIADRPSIGSTRYAYELGLPGLRSRGLVGFPYFVFYFEHGDHIDVWRVLHARRDIPSRMREPER